MKKIVLALFVLAYSLLAQDSSQVMIPLTGTGVAEFLSQYPDYDGRGTIVFVLDTGIDMGIDGLQKTSTGETKMIDVQDFTGQGEIPFYEADVDDEDGKYFFINEDENIKVYGADSLSEKAIDDEYYIGFLPEDLWKNSIGTSDINGNGTVNEQFEFVTFETENGWVLYIDTDNDNDISNEKALRNYKINQDYFFFPNEDAVPQLSIAVNILPEKKKVSFFFDDGGHGSHCSGIATGFNIGEAGINGVAPGARLIGLKIGNNNFSGGSTVTESMKNAFLYADKISSEIEEPCIINMSYGIGAEIEGRSDMELFIDQLTADNPYLYICKSNDNEGPGISTAGLPSNSSGLLASGAVLTKEVGNNLYGALLERDIILHFSSRGGESIKPDVIAPGACVSTVPNFDSNDKSWGTSMASPYSAGVCALLLSATKHEYPDIKIPSQFLFKVLRESATYWNDYDHLDQGGGYINASNAWKLLKKYINAGELKNFETYTTSAFAPHMPGLSAKNLYIRNGSYLTGNEDFTLTVSRNNTINQKKFYRRYNVSTDKDWLVLSAKRLHIRNNQTATITVKFDKTKMKEPGLYNAMITATRVGNPGIVEFETMVTVVIPYQFEIGNDYSQQWNSIVLQPGMHKRFFLNVPPGASNLKIKVDSDKGEFTYLRYYLHDPDGRQVKFGFVNTGNDGADYESFYNDPEPGVYELVVLGNYTAKAESHFNMNVSFDGIKLSHPYIGSTNSQIEITNLYNDISNYRLSCGITGYEKTHHISIDGVTEYKLPFEMTSDIDSKLFKLSLSKEDFNKLTDFAFFVVDEDGDIIANNALTYKNADLTVRNNFTSEKESYTLVLVPGFANTAGSMNIELTETTFLSNKEDVALIPSSLQLYPTVPGKINVDYQLPLVDIPEDAIFKGELEFKNTPSNIVEYETPLYFKYNGGSK